MSTERQFLSIRPASVSPVVLTCEHASNRLPFRTKLTRDQRAVLNAHWGWDIGAWDLTRELARRLGTGAVGGRWSRLLIDLNRNVDDAIPERIEFPDLVLEPIGGKGEWPVVDPLRRGQPHLVEAILLEDRVVAREGVAARISTDLKGRGQSAQAAAEARLRDFYAAIRPELDLVGYPRGQGS